ncbi:D-ala D-ala ligase family protein [Paraburkholderia xenovorans LB400]|uniref:acetyl-CoA carboxylase n=1 Tax=Paraburkholderia xenovorans (strain LB400) TaxID=266265 RepID=Q13I48_PARXL|nr:carboxyl transferase domain-containing protein [Paraburkholderia xenovorans]ABE36241.1 Putative carbamoyl-phosphate synthase/carboxyltransferase [Paraburkholderia xenovorans LB400]AIP34678.1 D-ala D-ala ligase family protein [Paraburkholderia xenovorans LB400]
MSRVLIANRGEVAVRIVRAAKSVGLQTVGIHTPEEANALHVRDSDIAVALAGVGTAAYLDIASIIAAAVRTNCSFIHPGYGFLSESAAFARACEQAGVTFIGPSPDTLDVFGDKASTRELAIRLDVPVLPATAGLADDASALSFMQSLAAPVIVKAVAGGGGRGMRIVTDPTDLPAALSRCRSEAERGFGRDDVYVERYLPRSRHIEVQVIGDGSSVVHLGTRDCSLQSRHQKVIEIAPAPWLPVEIEEALLEHALQLARAVQYRGAGTMEFLIDVDNPSHYYFIEGNPRLQVEHGITELVTGLDIVALQFAIARGRSLADEGITQDNVVTSGVAVEARVTLTTPGTIARFVSPGKGRVDSGAYDGLAVGSGFDPLLAKVMVHEPDYPRCICALADSLGELVVEGPATNRDGLLSLLADPRVRAGDITTTLIDDLPAASATALVSKVAGSVIAVLARPGEPLRRGQPIVVVEAMKMEHEVVAPAAGRLEEMLVAVGQQITTGQRVASMGYSGAEAEHDAAPGEPAARADLAENLRRHSITLDEARPEAVASRHARHKRTARENVADLVDPGSFVEYGALVIAAQRRRRTVEDLELNTPADGLVAGFGTVNGQQIAVLAYDYSVLAGTQGVQSHKKAERLFELARRRHAPVVIFAEGGGGRPGDIDNAAKATGMDLGTFVALGRLNGRVPTVAIASGRCFAGNAALVGACDLVIATADANIGMGGPAMIEGGGLGRVESRDIGPAARQFENGVVDVLVADEAEATASAKKYLSYFHAAKRNWTAGEQQHLRTIVPEARSRPFDVLRVIQVLSDDDAVLELRAGFGRGIITCLVRIEGVAIGIVANNGLHLGGAIDSDSADKMARFLALCDTYSLPIVSLCDTPGFMVGPASEETAAVRHFGRLLVAGPNLSVPLCTVVIRKAWGLGGQAMAGGGFRVPDAIVAWPTAEFGAMGPEGAVRLGFRRELEAIADPVARDAEFDRLVKDYVRDGRGYNAASAFEIDDVIDPADTRRWILATVNRAEPIPPTRRHLDTW